MQYPTETMFTSEQKNLIFENMSSGVVLINENEEITYTNSAFAKIFQTTSKEINGVSFREFFLQNKKNLRFNKLFSESIDKGHFVEKKVVRYRIGDIVKFLSVNITLIQQENTMLRKKEPFQGMLVMIDDVTDSYQFKQHKHDCAYIFAGLIFCISLYLTTWRLCRSTLKIPLTKADYTLMIEIMAFALFLEIIFFTSFSLKEIGLIPDFSHLKKDFKEIVITGGIVCTISILAKAILMLLGIKIKGYFIGGSLHGAMIYLFTAFIQEFLARGVIQTCVKSIMQVKYQRQFAIVLTSMLFSLMHLPFGFYFMLGAFVLSLALGIIYEHQKNIWGCVLLHWSCGYLAMCLFF